MRTVVVSWENTHATLNRCRWNGSAHVGMHYDITFILEVGQNLVILHRMCQIQKLEKKIVCFLSEKKGYVRKWGDVFVKLNH